MCMWKKSVTLQIWGTKIIELKKKSKSWLKQKLYLNKKIDLSAAIIDENKINFYVYSDGIYRFFNYKKVFFN